MTTTRAGWRSVKLKEVCRDITVGFVGPMATEYVGEGIPFLRSQNINPFSLNMENIKYITPEFHAKLRKSALKPGDVAVVRTGYPGTACVIPRSLPTSNCADLVIFRPSPEINSWFLTAIFNSAWGRSTVAGNLVGVAQQHFNVGAAKEMQVDLPRPCVQNKIAAVLSAYDALIENNTRRIQILEEMAQALYREWFVHFRFPGHEKSRMVDSEMGPIPEGWQVVAFTEVSEVLSGGTPNTSNSDYWGGNIPFFTPKDVTVSFYVFLTERCVTELGLGKCSSKLYDSDIVFITARGTVGQVVIPAVPMAMSQSSYALKSRLGVCPLFLFMQTRACVDMLKQNAHGAVFDTIIVDTFRKLRVIRPESEIIRQFEATASPFFDQMKILLKKNINLRRTRDMLLPKLISGEVDVADLDIVMGELG